MPLTMARSGEAITIRAVRGKDETRRFLESLGFVEGGQSDRQCKGYARCAQQKHGQQDYGVRGYSMRTLKEAKCGETVTVTKLGGEGALKRRIMDMGITKGTSIFVRKVAPLGDPVEVTVRGYELSLRRSDAENILVD